MIQRVQTRSRPRPAKRPTHVHCAAPDGGPSVKLPRRTAAALALMQIGVRDYAMIAAAVGLTEREIRRIDMAEDPLVRELGVQGIPPGEYFHLRSRVRCPRCLAWITVAPCVTCQVRNCMDAEDHGKAMG